MWVRTFSSRNHPEDRILVNLADAVRIARIDQPHELSIVAVWSGGHQVVLAAANDPEERAVIESFWSNLSQNLADGERFVDINRAGG